MSDLIVDCQSTSDDADDTEQLEIKPAENPAFTMLPETVEGWVDEDDVDDQRRDVEKLGHCQQD